MERYSFLEYLVLLYVVQNHIMTEKKKVELKPIYISTANLYSINQTLTFLLSFD